MAHIVVYTTSGMWTRRSGFNQGTSGKLSAGWLVNLFINSGTFSLQFKPRGATRHIRQKEQPPEPMIERPQVHPPKRQRLSPAAAARSKPTSKTLTQQERTYADSLLRDAHETTQEQEDEQ